MAWPRREELRDRAMIALALLFAAFMLAAGYV
jgi:hypothetical protein